MPDISLITSLYRSEKHLPLYIARVQKLATQLDLSLQIVVVVNDATDTETTLLEKFSKQEIVAVKVLHCERETLYASWNRGIAQADSAILGFWNVDDIRTAEGLAEGHRLLNSSADLVDFGFIIQQDETSEYHPPQYNPSKISPKTGTSPFFMFHRNLYNLTQAFNPNFRISGDFEWCKRETVRQATIAYSDSVAGTFILHGDNLSGGANPREWVEFNIALLIHNALDNLRPVDPNLMHQLWDEWGHQYATISDETANWLWGAGARERYEKYTAERQQHPLIRRFRLALARRGLLQSTEWDVHHG
ncbi:MAG: hypothetical protein Phog2KO_37300 [Phototrophicaceae bacterium]